MDAFISVGGGRETTPEEIFMVRQASMAGLRSYDWLKYDTMTICERGKKKVRLCIPLRRPGMGLCCLMGIGYTKDGLASMNRYQLL